MDAAKSIGIWTSDLVKAIGDANIISNLILSNHISQVNMFDGNWFFIRNDAYMITSMAVKFFL
jgi:hypothetical protein